MKKNIKLFATIELNSPAFGGGGGGRQLSEIVQNPPPSPPLPIAIGGGQKAKLRIAA